MNDYSTLLYNVQVTFDVLSDWGRSVWGRGNFIGGYMNLNIM